MTDNTVSERTVQTLALCRYGKVAPRLFEALLHHFGNVERIVKADSGTLMAIDGMEAAVANRVSQASDHFDDAVTYLKLLQQKNVEVVTRFDEEYPQGLFDINDPPSLLYIRGRLPENDRKRVALVGADQVTNEGIALTVEAAA